MKKRIIYASLWFGLLFAGLVALVNEFWLTEADALAVFAGGAVLYAIVVAHDRVRHSRDRRRGKRVARSRKPHDAPARRGAARRRRMCLAALGVLAVAAAAYCLRPEPQARDEGLQFVEKPSETAAPADEHAAAQATPSADKRTDGGILRFDDVVEFEVVSPGEQVYMTPYAAERDVDLTFDAIADFVQRYPEAQAFADEYEAEHDKTHEIDLTGEVAGGGIPLFIQWDRRWGYEQYGTSFLGINGCGPTCLSMVLCGLTGSAEHSPLEVARFSEAQGYYYSGTGTAWELMTEGARALGLQAEEGEISAEFIREHLSAAAPFICSMRPGDFTDSGHFIVLTGLDENGDVRVNDPNSPSKSSRSWPLERLLPQIKALWRFTA